MLSSSYVVFLSTVCLEVTTVDFCLWLRNKVRSRRLKKLHFECNKIKSCIQLRFSICGTLLEYICTPPVEMVSIEAKPTRVFTLKIYIFNENCEFTAGSWLFLATTVIRCFVVGKAKSMFPGSRAAKRGH